MKENYIFPFLWMRGEGEADIRREMEKIHQANIGAVCVEARPHPDFAGERWWHDMDIVLDEGKKRGMKVWILDDAHFPTGQANGLIPAKYPELARRYVFTQHVDVTGPIPCGTLDVELMTTRKTTWMDLAAPSLFHPGQISEHDPQHLPQRAGDGVYQCPQMLFGRGYPCGDMAAGDL